MPVELGYGTLIGIEQIDIEHVGVDRCIDVSTAQLPLPGIVHPGLPNRPPGHGKPKNDCPDLHVLKKVAVMLSTDKNQIIESSVMPDIASPLTHMISHRL